MTGASLADLARRVRRLPAFGRLGPEAVAEERDEIASELARLARAVDGWTSKVEPNRRAGLGGSLPAAVAAAPVRPQAAHLAQERARRAEAPARSQAAELERLRLLLAEALRRPRRRKRGEERQLELPLP